MSAPAHCFVVPAYGESPHLEACLRSLRAQTVPSDIVVVTSTPNAAIDQACFATGVVPQVHDERRGIAHDWNQALSRATAPLVTVAHQDDIYYPDFVGETLAAMAKSHRPVLAFTDYVEFTSHGDRPRSRLLQIKQALLHAAFLGRPRVGGRIAKLNALRFACPIPCPAVTLNAALWDCRFDESFQVNLDWATWIAASRVQGDFIWIRRPLMGHRIHEDSETSNAIGDGRRQSEDLRILLQLWPAPIARVIAKSYGAAYASNESP